MHLVTPRFTTNNISTPTLTGVTNICMQRLKKGFSCKIKRLVEYSLDAFQEIRQKKRFALST